MPKHMSWPFLAASWGVLILLSAGPHVAAADATGQQGQQSVVPGAQSQPRLGAVDIGQMKTEIDAAKSEIDTMEGFPIQVLGDLIVFFICIITLIVGGIGYFARVDAISAAERAAKEVAKEVAKAAANETLKQFICDFESLKKKFGAHVTQADSVRLALDKMVGDAKFEAEVARKAAQDAMSQASSVDGYVHKVLGLRGELRELQDTLKKFAPGLVPETEQEQSDLESTVQARPTRSTRDDVERYLAEAIDAINRGEPGRAIEALQNAERLAPDGETWLTAVDGQTTLLSHQHQSEYAVELLKRKIKARWPNFRSHPKATEVIVRALLRLGQMQETESRRSESFKLGDQALTTLQEAIDLGRTDARPEVAKLVKLAQLSRGKLFDLRGQWQDARAKGSGHGDYEKAIDCFRAIVECGDDSQEPPSRDLVANALLGWGGALAHEGNSSGAIYQYDKLPANFTGPDDGDLALKLAVAKSYIGKAMVLMVDVEGQREARTTLQAMLARYESATETSLQQQTAKATALLKRVNEPPVNA